MAKRKSKLEIIANSLKNNSRVAVLLKEDNADGLRRNFKELEKFYSRPTSEVIKGPGQHRVQFYVAPVNGLYTARKLQSFMQNLVPELKPSEINDFSQGTYRFPENFLEIGSLNFRESYGREKVRMHRAREITDDVFANDFNFKNGKKTAEEERDLDYDRLVQIRVYPNQEIGRAALQKRKSHDMSAVLYISLDEIRKYAPAAISRSRK
jgi:hypothetical protein